MEREKLQLLIMRGEEPEIMLTIAKSYLDGDVVFDTVAAEGWLMKAIEADDPVVSPKAMAMLATRILGKKEILTDTDYQDIRNRVETASGEERKELETLLKLVGNEQNIL